MRLLDLECLVVATTPISFLSLNLFSFCLLSLWYLSKFVALLYYCFILLRGCFVFINFFLITLFISHLNFSTNCLPSYLLPFTTFLNSYTNSSIILLLYSTFFNSITFIILLFPLLNSSFKSDKNSSIM